MANDVAGILGQALTSLGQGHRRGREAFRVRSIEDAERERMAQRQAEQDQLSQAQFRLTKGRFDYDQGRDTIVDARAVAAEKQRREDIKLAEEKKIEADKARRATLRASLKRKDPKLSDEEIDGIIEAGVDESYLGYRAPAAPRARRTQFDPGSGRVIDLDTGEPIGGGVTPKPAGGGQALPNSAIERLISLDTARSAAQDAIQAVAAANKIDLNITGRHFGVVPEPNWLRNVRGQGGELGRSARSKIGNLTSLIGNLRSGGAITPQEFERLEQFLPTKDDDEKVVEGKLNDFFKHLDDIRAIRIKAYQQYGRAGAGEGAEGGGDAAPRALKPGEKPPAGWGVR